MTVYSNTDYAYRTWLSLQNADGVTLGLAPGEEVELDLPDDFEDPYLKPVTAGAKKAKASESSRSEPVPPVPATEATPDASASSKE